MKNVLLTIFFVALSVATFAQQRSVFQAKKLNTVYSNFSQNNSKAVIDSLHYDGVSNNSIGTGAAASFGVYAYWPVASLTEFDGNVINQLKVYLPQPENMSSAQIEIHHDQTSGAVYTQEFTPVLGWNVIDLTNPMTISSTQDFYIGYFMEATGGYPAGCDAGPIAAGGNGNWIVMGGSWDHLNDLGATLTYNWSIRAMVAEAAGLDLSIKTLNLEEFTTETENVVAGSLQNMGQTPITAFDINYQIDGGDMVTMSVTDTSIAAWEAYDFAFPEIWTAVPGKYDVQLSISNINGGEDENAANNSLTKTVIIASGSVPMMPVYEHFTASTCPPCATVNSSIFTPQFITDNINKATVIRYQVSWPGAGDPYTTAEVATRVGYYGVQGVPALFLNGSTGSMSSTAQMQGILDIEAAKPAYIHIDAAHEIDTAAKSIELNVDITPYYTDNGYTVHAVVIEKETTGNVGSNGETEFQHVTMKMMPNGNGTQVDFIDGQVETMQLTADLSGTFIEEYTDLKVVVFVQKEASKMVAQSAYSYTANELSPVNFTVTDGENPIEGAVINIGGASVTTDASGMVTKALVDGEHSFEVTKAGFDNYTGTVTVAGASVDVSIVMAPNAIGMLEARLTVYPNPSNGMFTITVDGTYNVQVLNNLGQIVHTEKVESNKVLDLSNLSSGMYILTVKNTSKFATQNIIIK